MLADSGSARSSGVVGACISGQLRTFFLPCVGAQMRDNVASVTVEFQSTQTRMLTDSDDNSIEDEDTGTRDLIDIWTFERDLTLDDPNWKLAETETPDEA